MGLIRAGLASANGVLADQWKEFISCDALDADTLVAKGQTTSKNWRSSNKRGTDNVITDGSGIVVADGQCMLIVENGKVVEVCAEPGNFTYRTDVAPSVFTGDLGEGIRKSFEEAVNRFGFGGDADHDQRVYFVNTKEITGNKYGTPTPVPFRVIDRNIGLDVDISVRCNGEYSYRIVDPLLFYRNVSGNVADTFTRDQIDSQLKSLLLTALQPAFAKISAMGVRYSEVPGHARELADVLNQELSHEWRELRGIEIVSFGVNAISASEEDEQMIKNLQKMAVMRDPTMAAANLSSAQADAMRDAANNAGGAAVGFMGMNMAQGAGGMNANDLYAMGQQQRAQAQAQPSAYAAAGAASSADTWTCECGQQNTGKFCGNCGKPKPQPAPDADAGRWTCPQCGSANNGNFCWNCGSPRPADGSWTCSCGQENKGKFCSNCGKPRP